MRLHKRQLPLTVALGVAVAVTTGLAVTHAAIPSITAVDPYSWQANGTSPAAVAVIAGEEVKFSYPSGASNHYPVLHSGPGASPSCTNIPTTLAGSGPGWSGSCKFTQPGTYVFYCGVHGSLMTATVTVTGEGEPMASTGAATSVGETEATLNGTVDPEGHATSYFFNYGTTTAYGEKAPLVPQSAGEDHLDHAVFATATKLTPGTTYHFQLVAENSKGTTRGEDRTFTTASPPGPPTATTGQATAVGETEATLNGTVDPDGETTSYFFKWGTTTAYGQTTASVRLGSDHLNHFVSAALKGLAPGTTYHFRIVAENEAEAEGVDRTFTTASPPPPKEPVPAEEPSSPTPMPGPVSPEPSVPLVTPPTVSLGPALVGGSLKLKVHGSAVRGSIGIGSSGAGGRLEVQLLAKPSALGGRGSKPVVVGRVVRSRVAGGTISFSLSLTSRAKAALRRHRRLALTAMAVLAPPGGRAVRVTRAFTVRS